MRWSVLADEHLLVPVPWIVAVENHGIWQVCTLITGCIRSKSASCLHSFHACHAIHFAPLNVITWAGNREKPAENLCISKVNDLKKELSNRLARGRFGRTPQWWATADIQCMRNHEESWGIMLNSLDLRNSNWVFPMTVARSKSNKTPWVTERPSGDPLSRPSRYQTTCCDLRCCLSRGDVKAQGISIWGLSHGHLDIPKMLQLWKQ